MILLSAVMSAVFLEASFSYNRLGTRLTTPDDAATFTFAALELAGMAAVIVIGALTVVNRSQYQVGDGPGRAVSRH